MAGRPRVEIAFVWRNGRIEFGTKLPVGAMKIASGPPKTLRDYITSHARLGWTDELMAPGVSEAESAQGGLVALSTWLRSLPAQDGISVGMVEPKPPAETRVQGEAPEKAGG